MLPWLRWEGQGFSGDAPPAGGCGVVDDEPWFGGHASDTVTIIRRLNMRPVVGDDIDGAMRFPMAVQHPAAEDSLEDALAIGCNPDPDGRNCAQMQPNHRRRLVNDHALDGRPAEGARGD